jgi:hypothetical protein
MGIPGLLQLLKPVMTDVHVKRMSGKRVAIDAYVWLHKGTFSCALELAQGKHTDNYTRYCMKKVCVCLPALHTCLPLHAPRSSFVRIPQVLSFWTLHGRLHCTIASKWWAACTAFVSLS